jgi:hypothetical protein
VNRANANEKHITEWRDEALSSVWKIRAKDWDGLAKLYGLPEIVGARFVEAVVTTLAPQHGRLRLLTGLRDSVPVVMAIVHRTDLLTIELFQPSQMPISLLVAQDSKSVRRCFHEYLNSKLMRPMRFELLQMDSKHFAQLGSDECNIEVDYVSIAYVDFPSKFETYYELLSKNLRANCRKQRNTLARNGLSCRLEIVREAERIEQAVKQYSELELSGWKRSEGTAVDESSGQLSFYNRLLTNFAEIGQAQVVQLWISGDGFDRLVASDLCIVSGKVAFMLKTAYDEELKQHESLSSISPAALMHQDLFRYWIDELHVERLEFYGKTLDWHLRWTNQERVLYHLSVFQSARARTTFSKVKKFVHRFSSTFAEKSRNTT